MDATKVVNESAQGQVRTSTDRVGSNQLGKNEFLKLLVTQLGNQDPSNPVDSQAFVAQLAQFTSLEQMENMNRTLDDLVLAQATSNHMSMANLVGKHAVVKSDGVTVGPNGAASAVTANLGADAATVTVNVLDKDGKLVRTVDLGTRPAGEMPFTWDGRLKDGSVAPPGNYSIRVTAKTAKNESVAVDLRRSGTISGVTIGQGGAESELVIDGRKTKMSEVLEISANATGTGRSVP